MSSTSFVFLYFSVSYLLMQRTCAGISFLFHSIFSSFWFFLSHFAQEICSDSHSTLLLKVPPISTILGRYIRCVIVSRVDRNVRFVFFIVFVFLTELLPISTVTCAIWKVMQTQKDLSGWSLNLKNYFLTEFFKITKT